MRNFPYTNTASPDPYTLSLHDALPILSAAARGPERPGARRRGAGRAVRRRPPRAAGGVGPPPLPRDRKSTRLNSSHPSISYAVFCLKKKTIIAPTLTDPAASLYPI